MIDIAVDGKLYEIPSQNFTTQKCEFNKPHFIAFNGGVIGLWKICWNDSIKVSAPKMMYKVGWQEGQLHGVQTGKSKYNFECAYWIHKGFILDGEPLQITFKDVPDDTDGKEYILHFAGIGLATLKKYASHQGHINI